MRADEQMLIRRGPAVLLALLLSVLLGGAGTAAAAVSDGGGAAVRQSQYAKAADLVRASRRVSDEDPQFDDTPISSGREPAIETILLSRRPAADGLLAPSFVRKAGNAAPCNARAPPAA